MTRISTNTPSTRGLRYLNNASKSLNQTLERLSTGSKINRGKDAPAGIIASEGLRLQITAIEQSIKNSNRASNVIATADGALGEIGGLLNQVRGLVQEGLNSGALSDSEIDANQLQIDAALSAINRISQNTTFNGDKLIDGSKAFTTQTTAADAAELSDYQVNEAFFGTNSQIAIQADVVAAAQKGTLTYAGGAPRADLNFEVAGKRGSQVLFFDQNAEIDDIADAVNSISDATGVSAEITTAAVKGTATVTTGGTDTLTLTERRATDDDITVTFVDGSASSGTSVTGVTGVGTGTVNITIELGDAGAGSTATNSQIAAAIAANEDASALLTATATGTNGDAIAAGTATVTTGKELGEITFSSEEFGSSSFVEFKVLSGSFATENAAGSAVSRDAGTDIIASINGNTAVGNGLRASVKTAALDASLTFTEAANTVGTSTTVNVTGGGSLFQINDQVTSNGQLNVGIEAVNTARLGGVSGKLFELGTGGGKSLKEVGGSVSGADLVKIVDESLERVSTLRGRLGALQKNVIETNVSALGVALENLSEARSDIADTDFAEESANLTKSQILSQASISVLSIANQGPQQVLSLLR